MGWSGSVATRLDLAKGCATQKGAENEDCAVFDINRSRHLSTRQRPKGQGIESRRSLSQSGLSAGVKEMWAKSSTATFCDPKPCNVFVQL
jgi:hypothetical protein